MADAVTTAITAAQTAVTAVERASGGSLERATPPQLAPVKVALTAALAAADARLAVLDASIIQTSVGGVVVGQPITDGIATLAAQAKIARELSALRDTRGYLARIDKNIRTLAG